MLLIILSEPKLYRKLEFQFGVLKFPLNCLWKSQNSLRIFKSPLPGHAGRYYPIFEPSMLIFEVWGARAVRSDSKFFCDFVLQCTRKKCITMGNIRVRFRYRKMQILWSEPNGPPPGLCHGTAGGGRGCSAPSTQMHCAMSDGHCMLCL